MNGLARHFGLDHKVAVITGSTSGIGLAMADASGDAGASLRRIATPQAIAGTAVFLADPAAASITGQVIVVDGGTTITDGN